MKLQMDQIRGKLRNEKDYGSPEYFNLIKTVVPLRASFVKATEESEKKEIAGEEIRAWLGFLEARKEMLKDNKDFTINPVVHRLLKESFDRERDRKNAKVPSKALVDLHGNFSKVYKLAIPIHPRNLSQIVHPHQGYMSFFKDDRCFDWKELDMMYQTQIVASYEKSEGRFLLGEELSALAFWQLQDDNNDGHIDWEKTKQLMHAFRFDHIHTRAGFKKMFKDSIENDVNKNSDVYRFDLIRRIFLD